MRISNRTFVISGGSSGLGLATVQELLRCNAYVAVLDLSPISAELVSDETCSSDDTSQNPRVLYIETDVTQEDRVESAVDRVVEWTKSTGAYLGGVINGAGIALAELTINRQGEPHSTRTWERVLGINLTGTFYLTRLVAKHLVTVPREYELEETAREREEEGMTMKGSDGERGVIVMIASTVAYEGQAGQIAYAASKGAIRSMTLPMARDMSRYGVRVVTIAPGPFKTPMTGQFSQSMTDRLEKEAVLFPKRYGMPEEFAATRFLAFSFTRTAPLTISMAVSAPPNSSGISVPPPTQNPPTLAEVGDAQHYLDNLLRVEAASSNMQTPTNVEVGGATLYVHEVATKCAPQIAAPPWFDPIAAQLIQLTNNLDNLNNTVNNLSNNYNTLSDNYNNLNNIVNHPTNNHNHLNNTVNNLNNNYNNLNNTVNNLSDTVTNLEGTVNARFTGLERSMAILQNFTKGYGLLTPFNNILNDAGAPLPLPPITCAGDLANLSDADVRIWFIYYFPDRTLTGTSHVEKKAVIGRYIGCSVEM
ncbi:hypothetical protein GG344DRAFT_65922 [Lentinula edodes]|nr:hypothetical protein GG344DRAFT_65922 [Lentinula edodes]